MRDTKEQRKFAKYYLDNCLGFRSYIVCLVPSDYSLARTFGYILGIQYNIIICLYLRSDDDN